MNDRGYKNLFEFNEYDLPANRNGRLSERQTKRVLAEAQAERKSARESAGILFVIAALGFGVGAMIAINAPIVTGKVLIGFMLCLLWPLAWGGRAWMVMRSAPSERQDQVQAERGRVRFIRYEDDFVLEVEGRQFDLEKNPSNVIADGDELIVYFLERTEEVLSVEAL